MTSWQKPSEKFCDGGACVEVADTGSFVLVRSNQTPIYMAELTREEFSAFVNAVKAGEYDSYIL